MTDKRAFLKIGLATLVPTAFASRLLADPVSTETQNHGKVLAVLNAQIQKLLKYAHIYEEGTWTPTLIKNQALSVPVLKYDEATYTRVGNTVFVRIGRFIGMTSTASSGEGNLVITSLGLPGVTNATEFSGQAYINAPGGLPTNAIVIKNSYSSTDIYIGWGASGRTGEGMTFSGISFSYKI